MPSSRDLRQLVFPYKLEPNPDGTYRKIPLITAYHGDVPFTKAQIDGWRHLWPKADGLGWALPDGLVALDVDVKAGMRGGEHFHTLRQAHGSIPDSAGQETPSGGFHRVYELIPGRASTFRSHAKLPDGSDAHIDVIHRGHRFVAIYDPASLFNRPIAALPEAWLTCIEKGRTLRVAPTKSDGLIVRSQDFTIEHCIQSVTEADVGRRNETLHIKAFVLACRNLLDDHTTAELAEAALQAGLDESEIDSTIQSAIRAAQSGSSRQRDGVDRSSKTRNSSAAGHGQHGPRPSQL